MSKNTRSDRFRKTDVDQYDEDKFREDLIAEGDTGSVGPNEGNVKSYLNSGKNVDALRAALQNPPVQSKNQQVKDQAVQLVIGVLAAFKSSQIEEATKNLSHAEIDILMKYIYRGFALASDGDSATLLAWHEKVFSVGGLGCIMRVLTDRKRL